MTSTTYLYTRIYWKGQLGDKPKYLDFMSWDEFIFYTGITDNMKQRQYEHDKGLSKTTNRYNKSYYYFGTRYIKLNDFVSDLNFSREVEINFKRLSKITKMSLIMKWDKWLG